MLRKCLFLVAVCLLAVPAIAPATPLDPGIIIDSTDPPAINLFGVTNGIGGVQPTGDAAVVYQLEDNTGVINSITFDLQVNPGLAELLTPAELAAAFTCGQGSGKGYFLHCQVVYTDATGDLKYEFYGVKPPDGDEYCTPQHCEVNEQEGIPPGATFFVHLNGWVEDASVNDPVPLYNGLPGFTDSFTTPEPSTLGAAGIGLVLAALVEARRRKKTKPTR